MPKDEKVVEAMARYEAVEWIYDGLNGKVIKWTKENGSHHDDPSVLAFVTDSTGRVLQMAKNVSQPSAFAEWLDEQADEYERKFPSTRVPLIRAKVTGQGEGDERTVSCEALDEALGDGRAVLLYVGRSEREGDDKKARSQASASRKFEKGTLGSKKAAEAAARAVLLRLDIGDPDHARLAAQLGVEKVPTLLLWQPGAEQPDDLGGRISGAALTGKLKKLPEPDAE